MNILEYFSREWGTKTEILPCQISESLVPPPLASKLTQEEWCEKYIVPNSLSVTITLSGTNAQKLFSNNWAQIRRNQQKYFNDFWGVRKEIYYFVSELQNGTGNLHWHGVVSNVDLASRDMLLFRLRRHFGRSEVVQIKNLNGWYNYIHKENDTPCISNPCRGADYKII